MYKQYHKILQKSPLFKGIGLDHLEHLLICMEPMIRSYGKFDVVAAEGMRMNGIGIVLEGSLSISKSSLTGNRILMGTVGSGDLFGENAAFAPKRVWPANVESQEKARVMFIKPDNIINQCANSCNWHSKLQENMMSILSSKALRLTKKIEYLAIKGLRAKICTYLYDLYLKTGQRDVVLPMKKYELAEFFNTARPSLSRELINLREEGIIDFSGSHVRLLKIGKIESIIDGR